MKAIQLLGKEKIQLTDITKPEITEKEVLISVSAATLIYAKPIRLLGSICQVVLQNT